jgi:hypothetical protein
MPDNIRFQIVVKLGAKTVTTITGVKATPPDELDAHDIKTIPDVEAHLERLTGYRFHIEQAHKVE